MTEVLSFHSSSEYIHWSYVAALSNNTLHNNGFPFTLRDMCVVQGHVAFY
jgi:hypothetical protein